VVTPRAVFTDRGHWYVLADDRRSDAERSFRLDRIMAATATGDHDPPRDVVLPDTARWFADDSEVERVTVRLPTDMAWMIERYPVDSLVVDSADAAMSVAVMPVTSEEWLRRLLLRLGPNAAVVSPSRWAGLAAQTARLVLARYGSVSSAS